MLLAVQYTLRSLLAGKLPNGTVVDMADGPTSVFLATTGTNFAQMALYISLALLLVTGILLLIRRRKP
ncbi:sortase B protein-sorting domain-containing protein [Pygmaiobacter massiliensis]|uniref:sortase B protein-sorting domain-containing protein n=1 Tax=Pygmaiobacter massiliensis TaxID=1917873 RepID=UPI0015E0ACA6|nr:sortase B protein-sorting domain-containing protein [Pygmaiobacter massiliensis]